MCAACRRFRDAEERPSDLGLDDSDDDGVVREASPPAQELGPPLELSAPFVPRPDANTLWLARVRTPSPQGSCPEEYTTLVCMILDCKDIRPFEFCAEIEQCRCFLIPRRAHSFMCNVSAISEVGELTYCPCWAGASQLVAAKQSLQLNILIKRAAFCRQ